jgi:hypothetical protein
MLFAFAIAAIRQVRLSATARNEANPTTTVVARMVAVNLSARDILE